MGAFGNLMKKMGLVEDESKVSPEEKKKRMQEAQERLGQRAANKGEGTGYNSRFKKEADKLKD